MKQYKLVKGYEALSRLASIKMPAACAYKIYKLIKTLDADYNYFVNGERDLLRKYNADIKPDGAITFKNKDNAIMFQKELDDIGNVEADVDFTVIQIPINVVEDQIMIPADMMALDGFIEFCDQVVS